MIAIGILFQDGFRTWRRLIIFSITLSTVDWYFLSALLFHPKLKSRLYEIV